MTENIISRALHSIREDGSVHFIKKAWKYVTRRSIQLAEIPLLPFLILKMRSIDFGKRSLDSSIDFAFNGLMGRISPMQSRVEISELLRIAKDRGVENLVEIGTANGGTLFLLCRVAEQEGRVVSIDLPRGPFGEGYTVWRKPLYRAFAREKDLRLIRANSHSSSTKNQALDFLGTGGIDLLFIDGDHSYEGVKRDFELYAPEVNEGGLIVFHDIANPTLGVKQFWDEIKRDFDYSELVEGQQDQLGIGVLYND